jgi:hypothetical protein
MPSVEKVYREKRFKASRNRPQFRKVPIYLQAIRPAIRHREYARFYGLYETMDGKRKRFSFGVKISPKLTNRQLYSLIVITCNNLLDKRVPEHRAGEFFPSFRDLFRTRWIRVRKLLRYQAGVHYER